MLTDPLTPWAPVALMLASALSAAFAFGVFNVPGPVSACGLLGTWVFGFMGLLATAVWLYDNVERIHNRKDAIQAAIVQAISRTNPEQRQFIAWLLGAEFPDGEEPNKYPELIPLSTGENVRADDVRRIAAGMEGEELPAERSFTISPMPMRETYDKLQRAGVIQPARGNRRARANTTEFDQLVTLAKQKGRKR